MVVGVFAWLDTNYGNVGFWFRGGQGDGQLHSNICSISQQVLEIFDQCAELWQHVVDAGWGLIWMIRPSKSSTLSSVVRMPASIIR